MIIYIYICYAKTFIIVREIWGAISICVIACFKQITRLWNSRYANCSTWNETNGVHQDSYTNSDFMLTVRSGTRPDLPDFAVLGILVWAMTSQGHRTIRKWCSPAYNGYSFSRQMFMAKEDGGSRRAKRRSNTSGAWKSLRVLSPFNHIRFCGKTKISFGHTNAHMTDFQLKLYLIHIIIINHKARCRYKSQCTHSLLNFSRL